MPPLHLQADSLLTDRWLIEALSQMSSNPRVRAAAAAWVAAHTAALSSGLDEDVAQMRADRALQHALLSDRQSGAAEYPSSDCEGVSSTKHKVGAREQRVEQL